MIPTSRRPWLRVALLAGVAYLVTGRVFALPTAHVELWRLAAWVVSGLVFAAQIAYEHVRVCHSPRRLASHVALAAAIGAFGLAVAGPLHVQWATTGIRRSSLLALVLWPAIAGVPAFVAGFVAAALLVRVWPRGKAE